MLVYKGLTTSQKLQNFKETAYNVVCRSINLLMFIIIIILFSGRGCFIVISFVLPAGLSLIESWIQNERPFLCPFFNFLKFF